MHVTRLLTIRMRKEEWTFTVRKWKVSLMSLLSSLYHVCRSYTDSMPQHCLSTFPSQGVSLLSDAMKFLVHVHTSFTAAP
jgi:hypothetical protein